MPRRPFRVLVGALLLLQAAGCYTHLPAPASVMTGPPSTLRPLRAARLTLRGGPQVTLVDVLVGSDSVSGYSTDSSRTRAAFARDNVVAVETFHFSPIRFLGVVAGVLAGVQVLLQVALANAKP